MSENKKVSMSVFATVHNKSVQQRFIKGEDLRGCPTLVVFLFTEN